MRAPHVKSGSTPQGMVSSLSLAHKTPASVEAGGKDGHFHKPLPPRFLHGGFDYHQVTREGDVAIYEQTKATCPNLCNYEVIRIRKRDGFSIAGKWIEPAEVYPNAESWGSDGWTCGDKEAAFSKMREVVG